MKKIISLFISVTWITACACAQNGLGIEQIALSRPNLERGETVMQALSQRKSTRAFSGNDISLQDLSDLMWAANGVNRPDGRRTAPSAMNRQDVKVYVSTTLGNYLYDHTGHCLVPVSTGDARVAKDAPVVLVLVSDTDSTWGAIDAGIVSQNISLFCAAVGLGTYPRGTFDKAGLNKELNLKEGQTIMLCHPVGHFKE